VQVPARGDDRTADSRQAEGRGPVVLAQKHGRPYLPVRQRIAAWIVLAMGACAALGGWAGSHLGGGHVGMVALIAATCGVLGSFLPGGVLWVRDRVRRPSGPRQGAA
jgi:hypothetical protein